MTKTSALQLAIFDKPPYYEHEVITNLEELSLTSSQSAIELNKNFQNISKSLDNASTKIVSSIADEAEKSRIQSAIENERIASGISETNYRLLDVANGIDGLSDVVRYGNENIVEAIGQSSEQIVNGLVNIDGSLGQIDFQMRMVNSSLSVISNQLEELLKKISKPNETEALELADQARINLSLNKKETALKVTRNALELSNGTSITVLAYHILTLSLFDDKASKKEIIEIYTDYVNLVGFKLSDRQSDETVVMQEINSTLYPVMATMGYNASNSIMLLTQTLYTSLYKNRTKIDKVLKKPLSHDATLEMITHPNQLREFHWSVLLNEYVVKKQSLDVYVAYIVALAKSEVLIKNELMILVVRHFYNEGFLYGAVLDSLAGNSDDALNDALKVILSLLPQDIIDIDHKTYWAMELYTDQQDIKVDVSLKVKFTEGIDYVETDIQENYITLFDNVQQKMYTAENEIVPQIEAVKKEHLEISQKKMDEWEKYNKAIDDKGYEKKIKHSQSQIPELQRKIGSDTITTVFTVLGGLVSVAAAISFFAKGDIFAGLLLLTLGVVMYAGIGFVIGKVINTIVDAMRKSSLSTQEDNIPYYRKELAKKYNIKVEKQKIDTPYNQKMTGLANHLEAYKQKNIDNLISKLDLLVDKYTPSKIEQLSKSYDEIKECISKKMFGRVIFSKRPNGLNYKQSGTSNPTAVHKENKEYVEIDIAKVAEEYGARWRGLHAGEQPTTEKLISWIEDEAYRGDGMAQYLLGTIYEDDDEVYGIEADRKKALFWFEKAAQYDIAEAQCKMGEAYLHGNGFKLDGSKAFEWFEKAKDLGHPSGKFNYGLMRSLGSSDIEQNIDEGIYWIKEARDDGLEHAKEFIEKEGLE